MAASRSSAPSFPTASSHGGCWGCRGAGGSSGPPPGLAACSLPSPGGLGTHGGSCAPVPSGPLLGHPAWCGHRLRLTVHVPEPQARLSAKFIIKLQEGISASSAILQGRKCEGLTRRLLCDRKPGRSPGADGSGTQTWPLRFQRVDLKSRPSAAGPDGKSA